MFVTVTDVFVVEPATVVQLVVSPTPGALVCVCNRQPRWLIGHESVETLPERENVTFVGVPDVTWRIPTNPFVRIMFGAVFVIHAIPGPGTEGMNGETLALFGMLGGKFGWRI